MTTDVVASRAEESRVTREKVFALQSDDRVAAGPPHEPVGAVRTGQDSSQRHPAHRHQRHCHHCKE